MWAEIIPMQRNPMELVTIRGATKRTRKPLSLTVEMFQLFVKHLEEPARTIALVCVSFGLRISEGLALRWKDVDWLNRTLRVERAIVRQRLGDVKTEDSAQEMSIDSATLEVLKTWRQSSQFPADEDWVFASPVKLGRLPISYPWVWRSFQRGSIKAGIPCFDDGRTTACNSAVLSPSLSYLAGMAEPPDTWKAADVGAVSRNTTAVPAPPTSDHTGLSGHGESRLKNPLREICTVGSVRGEN